MPWVSGPALPRAWTPSVPPKETSASSEAPRWGQTQESQGWIWEAEVKSELGIQPAKRSKDVDTNEENANTAIFRGWQPELLRPWRIKVKATHVRKPSR